MAQPTCSQHHDGRARPHLCHHAGGGHGVAVPHAQLVKGGADQGGGCVLLERELGRGVQPPARVCWYGAAGAGRGWGNERTRAGRACCWGMDHSMPDTMNGARCCVASHTRWNGAHASMGGDGFMRPNSGALAGGGGGEAALGVGVTCAAAAQSQSPHLLMLTTHSKSPGLSSRGLARVGAAPTAQ